MKSEKGSSHIVLIIVTIIIIGLIALGLHLFTIEYQNKVEETIKTDMLLIKGKIKVLYESSVAKEDDTLLKGRKVSENLEDEKIKNLLDKKVITQEEENFDGYYIIDKQTLGEIGLGDIKLKEENYIIVNYKTKEVIYSQGFEIEEKECYKLTQLLEIEEERERQKQNQNQQENSQPVVQNTEEPEETTDTQEEPAE